jgi:hypothetical protein
VDPSPARLSLLVVAAGVVLDFGLRGGVGNLLVTAGVVLFVITLITNRRLAQTQARWLAIAAVVPAAGLAWRSSPWLLSSNAAAIVVILGAAIVLARSGSIWDTTVLRLVIRGGSALERAFLSPLVLRPLAKRMDQEVSTRLLRIGLALALALPLLAIVVALLAASDPVFAGLVTPDADLGPVLGHVGFAAVLALGLLCTAVAALGDADDDVPSGGFGATEVVTMLGLAAAVLGLFVFSQLLALTSAGDRLVEEAGLEPADYARSGFFQLCWATGFLLGFLAVVRFVAAPEVWSRPVVRVLGALVPALALGLVVVSLRRMGLYDRAFGLTMLRLWVVGAALWMGTVLVLVAVRNLGVGGDRRWVLGGAGTAALVLVLLANLGNPEAFVVHHNVSRAGDDVELDVYYLEDLSDDAVPALVSAAPTLDQRDRRELRASLCRRNDAIGAAALNVSASQAADARHEFCTTP